jgi:hypothetical protein
MRTKKTILTTLAATLAALAASPAGAVPTPAPGAASRATVAGCKHARIGGHKVCLAAGQHCNRRYEKQYVKNGFSCAKIGHTGHKYRLVLNRMSF